MSIKPILFNTDMVKAILEGRKTVTRRVVKERRWEIDGYLDKNEYGFLFSVYVSGKEKNYKTSTFRYIVPQYRPGDVLWVRETFRDLPITPDKKFLNYVFYYYKADGDLRPVGWRDNWRPSIHMPKEAARIFLRVKDIRVERLQEAENLRLEGIKTSECCDRCYEVNNKCDPKNSFCGCDNEVETFAELWNSTINKKDISKYGWETNPYVWVIDFERCEKPEGFPN